MGDELKYFIENRKVESDGKLSVARNIISDSIADEIFSESFMYQYMIERLKLVSAYVRDAEKIESTTSSAMDEIFAD